MPPGQWSHAGMVSRARKGTMGRAGKNPVFRSSAGAFRSVPERSGAFRSRCRCHPGLNRSLRNGCELGCCGIVQGSPRPTTSLATPFAESPKPPWRFLGKGLDDCQRSLMLQVWHSSWGRAAVGRALCTRLCANTRMSVSYLTSKTAWACRGLGLIVLYIGVFPRSLQKRVGQGSLPRRHTDWSHARCLRSSHGQCATSPSRT
jgi:hypothetical protein